MSKIIIISDIHNNIETAKKVLNQDYDKAIFLGDYFDSFGDSPFEAMKTALFLKESLKNKKHIHLMGNHDMPYRFPKNSFLDCPGWTKEKSNEVNEILNKKDWDKIKLFHRIDNFLFSHAGIDKRFLKVHPFNGHDFKKLERDSKNALTCAENGVYNDLTGQYGLTWIRPNEIIPVEHLTQVVGHTNPAMFTILNYKSKDESEPKCFQENGTIWFCDCLPKYYLTLENNSIKINKI